MFREGWVVINQVPTHVLTWGGWIEDEIKSDSILLCITGNPGVPDFYVIFLSTLYSLIKMPVWVINFAGCEIPTEKSLVLPSLKKNGHLYNLSGQVKHKQDFIEKYIPSSKKIYLIGHSVGGKIVVELMKREVVTEQMGKAFLLFPTLEHIAKTKNGLFVMNILQYLIPITLQIVFLLSFLPDKMRLFILKIYFAFKVSFSVDKNCLEGGLKLFNYKSLRGVFFLAMDEMHNIKELDTEVLEKYSDQIYCYYSKTDGWAPPSHYENLRTLCPGVKAIVVEDHIPHAFVLETSREMAEKISHEIINDRPA